MSKLQSAQQDLSQTAQALDVLVLKELSSGGKLRHLPPARFSVLLVLLLLQYSKQVTDGPR